MNPRVVKSRIKKSIDSQNRLCAFSNIRCRAWMIAARLHRRYFNRIKIKEVFVLFKRRLGKNIVLERADLGDKIGQFARQITVAQKNIFDAFVRQTVAMALTLTAANIAAITTDSSLVISLPPD